MKDTKNGQEHCFPDKPWLPDPALWHGTWREDWRITGQEGYLKGKGLYLKEVIDSTDTSKKHLPQCNFCFSIIAKGDHAYYEPINDVWICKKCFEDFREHFYWIVIQNNNPIIINESGNAEGNEKT